jgi:hypothetical protein
VTRGWTARGPAQLQLTSSSARLQQLRWPSASASRHMPACARGAAHTRAGARRGRAWQGARSNTM